MATPRDYQVASSAARTWLEQNEAFYASMVPQGVIDAVSKAIVDAVDADRARPRTETNK